MVAAFELHQHGDHASDGSAACCAPPPATAIPKSEAVPIVAGMGTSGGDHGVGRRRRVVDSEDGGEDNDGVYRVARRKSAACEE